MPKDDREYRVSVRQDGKKRFELSVDTRSVLTDGTSQTYWSVWRPLGVTGAGEDIYQALAKLGEDAQRVSELRVSLLRKVGR